MEHYTPLSNVPRLSKYEHSFVTYKTKYNRDLIKAMEFGTKSISFFIYTFLGTRKKTSNFLSIYLSDFIKVENYYVQNKFINIFLQGTDSLVYPILPN